MNEPKDIASDAEYEAALKTIEELWDTPDDSPEGRAAARWTDLIRAYERTHYPLDAPTGPGR